MPWYHSTLARHAEDHAQGMRSALTGFLFSCAPHSCNVDCAIAFYRFFDLCQVSINSMFDVAGNDTTRDHRAASMMDFEATCSRIDSAPLFRKIDEMRSSKCAVDTSDAISSGAARLRKAPGLSQ